MKVLAPAILLLEAIAVALAIPVAVTTSGRGAAAGWLIGALAVALLVGSALARRSSGVAIGWALQVAVLVSGLVVPAMFALGLIFLAVWIVAVVYGGKADRVAAARRAGGVPEGGRSTGEASAAGSESASQQGAAPAGSDGDPPASR